MKKSEMIDHIATKHNLSKAETGRVLDSVIELYQTVLRKDGRLSVPGFGTFVVSSRAARKGRNPKTGEAIKIKAAKVVRFKAAPSTKAVAAKFKG